MNQQPTSGTSTAEAGRGGMPGAVPNGGAGQSGAQEAKSPGQGTYSQGLQTAGQGQVSGSRRSGMSSPAEQALLPPVDIIENEAGVTIYADMPGVSKDRLGVRVEGDSLTIEGSTALPDTSADMELIYGEVLSPSYRRSFTLSRDLDPSKIQASLSNGVLCLTIPKAEEAKPRRIEVQVG